MRSLPSLAWAALAALTLPAQTTYPGVTYATVPVQGAPLDLQLELVVPAGAGPWPLVVWVHGGGWSGGSRLPIPSSATRLLPRGYAVASIDYRLSGQAIWPAQIQDCKAAIRYLRANAATYGLDPDRIGVMGSSAGGHLVAALATMGDVGATTSGSFVVDLEGSVGAFLGTSSRVQAAVDLFGPMNMLFANDFPGFDHDALLSPESRLLGAALQTVPERWATVDPVSFLSPDDPPILALHGTDDTTVPFQQSEQLLAAAAAIGHDVALFAVQDNGHGGPGFSAPDATAAIDAFLDRTLRDLPATTVRITAVDAVAGENGDPATFAITRSGSVAAALPVRVALRGEPTVGADCAPLPLLVTIPAGTTQALLDLQPLQDALVEGDEPFAVHLVATADYRVDHTAARATAMLVDDDTNSTLPIVSVQALDPSATEVAGNPGAIRLVRTGSTAAALTVSYAVLGTATSGSDYVPLSGSATFAAGSAVRLLIVQPLQDLLREPGETVVLELLPGVDYTRGATRQAHVVIADDDRTSPLPVVSVIATDRDLAEPGGQGAFTLMRTGATTAPLTIDYAISGSAAPGVDYVALPGTAVIPAGSAWVRVPVPAIDDNHLEGEENIVLRLLPAATQVTSLQLQQELWLTDDEVPAPIPTDVGLVLGPIAVGATGTATFVGGAPNGIAWLLLAPAPAHLPLPPYGTLLLDPGQSGLFADRLLDGNGEGTLGVVVPATQTLAGQRFWWQGLVLVPTTPFLRFTTAHRRTLLGPTPF
jgi:acetyl esterase/lipase